MPIIVHLQIIQSIPNHSKKKTKARNSLIYLISHSISKMTQETWNGHHHEFILPKQSIYTRVLIFPILTTLEKLNSIFLEKFSNWTIKANMSENKQTKPLAYVLKSIQWLFIGFHFSLNLWNYVNKMHSLFLHK